MFAPFGTRLVSGINRRSSRWHFRWYIYQWDSNNSTRNLAQSSSQIRGRSPETSFQVSAIDQRNLARRGTSATSSSSRTTPSRHPPTLQRRHLRGRKYLLRANSLRLQRRTRIELGIQFRAGASEIIKGFCRPEELIRNSIRDQLNDGRKDSTADEKIYARLRNNQSRWQKKQTPNLESPMKQPARDAPGPVIAIENATTRSILKKLSSRKMENHTTIRSKPIKK